MALLIISAISGCSKKQILQEHNNSFFAWMDAYIAIEKSTSNSIAATLFFKDVPFLKDDVSNISFLDIGENVKINDFKIENMDQSTNGFSSYAITLDFTASEVGVFKTSGLLLNLKSNKSIKYLIGGWVFDVNPPGKEIVNSWNALVASTNPGKFPYDYSLYQNGKITKIYYADNSFVKDDSGLEYKGEVNISNIYSAPLVYIKAKIIVSVDGEEIINYGKGTYCGAMNFAEDAISASKKRND